ncbi:core component of ECF transporter [Shewanella yunxiaonensis]|uniref:Core component of ECF transporter n=1 Tax=Shewanella yunxiaonensis TaxID=2829809 RepID=A0ABX7YTF7_9GAMM|nr:MULTISPECIES: core component of ECF transporter [Shewanella]MDF0534627.1 core component of ECF transporter [Shewanella sp. A32]QUN05997.1 core component of ECF transporter [Shewanella yunxiaonensis]
MTQTDNKLGFQLQDALFIGFCATLLVALKGMLRIKLGLSGHSMLLMSFFYLICYGAVGRKGAITTCGALAGAVAAILGIGKGGPLIFLKFFIPALSMDLALIVLGTLLTLRWRFVIVALVGCLAWSAKGLVEDLLIGMSQQVALVRFGLKFLMGALFSVAGALLVIPVIRRLKAHDLLYKETLIK